MSLARKILSESDQKEVIAAIEAAEKNSSGEIRLHIEDKFKGDVMDRATYIFEKLEMHNTALRNGVLFYVSIKPHGFAILGDVGINQKVPEDFWEKIKEGVISDFGAGEYAKGLCEGIIKAGEQLKKYFPYQSGDVNELSDEISFGA